MGGSGTISVAAPVVGQAAGQAVWILGGTEIIIGDVSLDAGVNHIGQVGIDTPLPAGTNSIGAVTEQIMDNRWGPAVNIGTGSNGSSKLVTLIGDTTLYTPAAGKAIRLKWFNVSVSSLNGSEVLVTVKFGGAILWQEYLAPGAIFQRSVSRESAADGTLVINLSVAANCTANYDIVEF